MANKSLRILIVDDDADILANLSDILTEVGYETVTACDGEHALEKVGLSCEPDAGRFDLCLMDFKMPGMDGIELLEQILLKHPRLPTIMITAYAGDGGVNRALAAGSSKVMQKPINIDELLEAIAATVASH